MRNIIIWISLRSVDLVCKGRTDQQEVEVFSRAMSLD